MDESEFLRLAEQTLTQLETTLENLFDAADIDVDLARHGNVLEVTFANRNKLIINSQASMQEIWVAAKSGGFHFRYQDQQWINTRTQPQQLLSECLQQVITDQTGVVMRVVL